MSSQLSRPTISISRRADCVESPSASRHAPKRVSPPPARAKGAVGLDAMLGGPPTSQVFAEHNHIISRESSETNMRYQPFCNQYLFEVFPGIPLLFEWVISGRNTHRD